MHTSLLLLLCRRLCAVAVWPLLILSAVRADGEPFEARFETDATGTWLTYPTVPGWHYKVESSPTLEEDDFTFVPSTFSYGNGTTRRLFIAPPRPPADPNYQPPVRTFRLINVRLHVATDPGMEKVELLGPGDPPAWGMEMNRSLPVFRWTRHVFLTGDTPTERWMFSATITARPYASEDPATPGFQFPGPAVIPQAAQADIDFVTDHWQDIIGHLTPSPEDTTLLPAPPPPVTSPESTPAPPLTSPARRYYRVRQTAIDTNGNGLYDWWELAHGYSAFAEPGTPGAALSDADADFDGLSNFAEQLAGTDPNSPDSDGDLALDGQEVEHETGPLNPSSTPLMFVSYPWQIRDNMFPELGTYRWAAIGNKASGPGPNGLEFTEFYKDPPSGFHTGYPPYNQWHALLNTTDIPGTPPWWAPEYKTCAGSRDHTFALFKWYLPGTEGVIDISEEEGDFLSRDRIWLRGPQAPQGGMTSTVMLLKQRAVSADLQGLTAYTANTPQSISLSTATFYTPEGQRVSSNYLDAAPDLIPEPSSAPGPQHRHEVNWTLIEFVRAPEVLSVNSDFHEQRLDASGFALPDCEDEDLRADRNSVEPGILKDEVITTDLHEGWFGIPLHLIEPAAFEGCTIHIKKKNILDPDTNRPESGQVRFWATRGTGTTTAEQWPLTTYDITSLEPVNLVGLVYGPNATIPSDSNVRFWMEGIKPGKITLEFTCTGPNKNVAFEQSFLVCTRKTKQQWIKEIRDQILLQSQGTVDLNHYLPESGWLPGPAPEDIFHGNSFRYHRHRVAAIYDWYGQLYQQFPDKLDWAGAACLVGGAAYGGLTDLIGNGLPAGFSVETRLQGGQILIFKDFGWQQRAWVASGIPALRWVDEHDDKSINGIAAQKALVLDDWIDLDDAIAGNNWPGVKQGSRDFVRREQSETIVPMWTAILNMNGIGGPYPGFLEVAREAALNPADPASPMFREVVPGGKLEVYDHRNKFAFGWAGGHLLPGAPVVAPDVAAKGVFPVWWGEQPSVSAQGYFTTATRLQLVKSPLLLRARAFSVTDYLLPTQ